MLITMIQLQEEKLLVLTILNTSLTLEMLAQVHVLIKENVRMEPANVIQDILVPIVRKNLEFIIL